MKLTITEQDVVLNLAAEICKVPLRTVGWAATLHKPQVVEFAERLTEGLEALSAQEDKRQRIIDLEEDLMFQKNRIAQLEAALESLEARLGLFKYISAEGATLLKTLVELFERATFQHLSDKLKYARLLLLITQWQDLRENACKPPGNGG